MKKIALITLLLFCVLGLASCGREYPFEFNAKFKVTINTPEGVKTASSVAHYKLTFPDPDFDFLRLPEAPGSKVEFNGEAIVFEINSNRFLFILLPEEFVNTSSYTLNYPDYDREYTPISVRVEKTQQQIDAVKATGAVQEIPREIYPYFVTFDDIKNPDKLIKVDPANLAATFGPGYSLRSLTMTYTDEPVTTGKVIAAVGEGFFEKWSKRRLITSDAEWAEYQKEFNGRLVRSDFIAGDH